MSDLMRVSFTIERSLYEELEKLIGTMGTTEAEIKYLEIFKENLEKGIDLILEISKETEYKNENLRSIPDFVNVQLNRLKSMQSQKNEVLLAVNF